jgi:plasmid replication initiation protein
VNEISASRDLKAAMAELLKNSVTFFPKDGEYEEISYPWLDRQSVKRGRGEYVVEFNRNLVPYITGLSEKFTQFYLHHCGKLNNARTIRLYESLCQWAQAGVWKVDVGWLVSRYELPKSQAENFAEMRRKFIDPAIKRINENTPLKVDFKTSKGGSHKTQTLVFNIITDES